MAAFALPETLRSITAVKFAEVTKQRDAFEKAKASIYARASSAEDSISAAQALIDGTKRLKNVHIIDDEASGDEETYSSGTAVARDLHIKSQLLRQATLDPSVRTSLVSELQESLKSDLELESVRRQHAHFFSALVTEWLSNPDSEAQDSQSSSFEEIGRKEMHEQRATWEELVFTDKNTDVSAIKDYLQTLFNTDSVSKQAHEQIAKGIRNFGSSFWDDKNRFDNHSLKVALKGLIASNLLSDEKVATAKTFLANGQVLTELGDVLNMRFASLADWNWTVSGEGIPVEMRRHLNGKYRVFMDEDLLDAILLYEIGLSWSIHFKSVFTTFFNSLAWNEQDSLMSRADRQRREYYLQEQLDNQITIQKLRMETYARDYFLTQLPSNRHEGQRDYDDDNSGADELSGQQASGQASGAKGAIRLKHKLLHLLITESLIAKDISPDKTHTVLRSDFKWFGPSLQHDTIFTVLKFFGVSDEWLEFFKKFLKTPIQFVQDGANASVRIRACGVPISHALSDVMGEVILFVMDFAVNRATSSYLYRMHDDFWIWGSEETCLRGWQAMTQFAAVMGIEFNEEKTGTVRFGQKACSAAYDHADKDKSAYLPGTKSLPEGQVRWGFLELDASSGRFLVDQTQVDEHITELRRQLSYTRSIFSYIRAYNAYAGRFFTNNFGESSYAFGRDHVDMIISTFQRIQQELFPGGSVTDHLAELASQRFEIHNLPQGVWYFPVTAGGFALLNPLINLLGIRGSLRTSTAKMLQKSKDEEEADYHRAAAHFKQNGGTKGFGKHNPDLDRQIQASGESFLTKEEYFRYREETSIPLADLYSRFLEVPTVQQIEETSELTALLVRGNPSLPKRGSDLTARFGSMKHYWKWMVALHGEDIVERYGSVTMVERGQVPLGVLDLLLKGKVKWRG